MVIRSGPDTDMITDTANVVTAPLMAARIILRSAMESVYLRVVRMMEL